MQLYDDLKELLRTQKYQEHVYLDESDQIGTDLQS